MPSAVTRIRGTRSFVPAVINGIARVGVRVGATEVVRRYVRLIAGVGVSLSVADDPANEEAEVTVTALHGDQPGGTLHATATAGGAAGFMSGTDKVVVDSVSAIADGSVVGTVQTNDATPAQVLLVTPPDNRVMRTVIDIVGIRADGAVAAGYLRSVVGRRTAGAMTVIGTQDLQTAEEAGAAGWDVLIDASGASIRVRVVGAAATTVKWKARARVVNHG